MKYREGTLMFGDFMEFLVQNPETVVFIGLNDLLSNNALKEFSEFAKGKSVSTLVLNYDRNKALMLDLNIRKVPVVQFYKEAHLVSEVYQPNIVKSILEDSYEKAFRKNH